MFSWFKKQDWRLVKTLQESVSDTIREDIKGVVYFHLYESDLGNRKVEFTTTMSRSYSLEPCARKLRLYNTKIYRWEHGRVDPDIPTYNQVPEEDTVNVLRGTLK